MNRVDAPRARNVRLLLTGVAGVGKSSIAADLAHVSGYRVREFGEEMQVAGRAHGTLPPGVALRDLKLRDRRELQELVAASVRQDTAPVVLIVAHLIVNGPEGLVPGLPRAVLEFLELDGIVLLQAPPAEIVRRRIARASSLSQVSADEVALEAEAVRIAAVSAGQWLGVPLSVFSNALEGYTSLTSAVAHTISAISEL